MVTLSFKEFMQNLIVEALHPELQAIANAPTSNISKQTQLAKKIKELTDRGEPTGIEGNMPKGSSRAYLQHSEPHSAVVDGVPASFKTGTKVAIRAPLDRFHKPALFDGLSLGRLQNKVENNDHYVNQKYRVLTNQGDGHFSTNHDDGIFPPLVEHDENNHEWAQVGHARNVGQKEFRDITREPGYPKGISHPEFVHALTRAHLRDNGRYWEGSAEKEKETDHIEAHPLVQKFLNHQRETGGLPYDYGQIRNMGVFDHPNGQKFIVARDHGFDDDVSQAYRSAKARKYKPGY